jgi:hypothetical protein|nr:hypothetical protein [uncultured Oscillibacter sp.]
MERSVYEIRLQTPMGTKRGLAAIAREAGRITAELELFGRRHRFTGSGECLEGMLHTALGSVPCVLQGRFSPEGVDAVLRTEERSFPLTGIPAWDGRDLK